MSDARSCSEREYRRSIQLQKTPLAGLEPAIFGLEVQRVIHYAKRARRLAGALVYSSQRKE